MLISPASSAIVNCTPYHFLFPTSSLPLCASKKRVLKSDLLLKPMRIANPQGFGGRKMPKLNQVNALEEEDAVLSDASLGSSSGFSLRSFEATLNKSSKWLVAGLFGLVILWKHDAEVLWAATGSILNSYISQKLKHILNHERPSGLRSDPGMPSSHAQSISFVSVFAVITLIQQLGVNIFTVSLSTAIIAFGSYFSWLRVSQQLHTISQVLVGAILGAFISIVWFWLWHAFVYDAFLSSIWVRISVVLGSISFCIVFVAYVIQNWLSDERI